MPIDGADCDLNVHTVQVVKGIIVYGSGMAVQYDLFHIPMKSKINHACVRENFALICGIFASFHNRKNCWSITNTTP
jgi:hypothetical protein